MDPPTHGLIGAVIGQAFFGPSLGRRALGWGAVLSMLPDVDVVAIPLGGELGEWRYHRGVTHGLWCAPVVGTALGLALWRWRGRGPGASGAARTGPAAWVALAVASLLAHPLADACTSYGTRLLWPSARRFAWDALPIIDVPFSAALVLAVVVGVAWPRSPRPARAVAVAALAFCAAWEAYGLHLNRRAEGLARRQLEAAGFRARVHAYPVLLQPWLRRVVARDEADGVRAVGWISTWRPGPVEWHFFRPATGPAVESARRLADVRVFEWFAMGQTAASIQRGDSGQTVGFDDLRYGSPTDPEHGLWGVRVALSPDGEPLGDVRVVRNRPPDIRFVMRWLWAATFGR